MDTRFEINQQILIPELSSQKQWENALVAAHVVYQGNGRRKPYEPKLQAHFLHENKYDKYLDGIYTLPLLLPSTTENVAAGILLLDEGCATVTKEQFLKDVRQKTAQIMLYELLSVYDSRVSQYTNWQKHGYAEFFARIQVNLDHMARLFGHNPDNISIVFKNAMSFQAALLLRSGKILDVEEARTRAAQLYYPNWETFSPERQQICVDNLVNSQEKIHLEELIDTQGVDIAYVSANLPTILEHGLSLEKEYRALEDEYDIFA